MARQNRWAAFGQAFNAVYDVGTTLARDYETLKINNREDEDWKDGEGNALTGDALTRAKADALAGIEEKYGSARDALAIRTGAEDYITKGLNNQYLSGTLDERMRTPGLQNANLEARTSYTNSAAGLNRANTNRVGLANEFTRRTMDSRVLATDATNNMTANRDQAQGLYYSSPEYDARLTAEGRQATNEADAAANLAGINRDIYGSDYYRDGVVANARRTARIAEIDAEIAATPEFAEQRQADFETAFNNSMAAAANSATDLRVAENPTFQANREAAGLAAGATAAADGQNAQLIAERELAANQWISDWSQSADPSDPASMSNLVAGLKRINPEMGMQLEQNYGEHELWRIANDSVRYRAGANAALSDGGIPGLEAFIEREQFQGADRVKVNRNEEDGSVSMVEVDAEGNVVRTIAEGTDDRNFMENLQGYLDPATMLEISKQQYDNMLTKAQAEYNSAQARARGNVTMDSFIAGRLSENPNDPLALTLAFRSNPDAIPGILDMANDNARIAALGGNSTQGDGTVVDPAAPMNAIPFNPDRMTEQQVADARTQAIQLLSQPMTVEQRAEIVANNQELLQSMELYQPELAKLAIAEKAADALAKEDLNAFFDELQQIAGMDPEGGNPRGLQARQSRITGAAEDLQMMQNPEVLTIVLDDLKDRLANAPAPRGNGSRAAQRRLELLQNNISALEQALSGGGLSGR